MKRYLCTILIITLITAVSAPAYAGESISGLNVTEKMIQNEIEEMKSEVWADLYKQLEAQDALDGLEYFQSALEPEIRAVVYQKYGVTEALPYSTQTVDCTYYFPNGGLVSYYGELNSEYVVTAMNPEETKMYYFEHTNTLGDIITAVLGFLPGTTLIGLASLATLVMNAVTKADVEDNDFYSKVMYVSWGSGLESATYIYAWDNHPRLTVYNVVSRRTVEYGVENE